MLISEERFLSSQVRRFYVKTVYFKSFVEDTIIISLLAPGLKGTNCLHTNEGLVVELKKGLLANEQVSIHII